MWERQNKIAHALVTIYAANSLSPYRDLYIRNMHSYILLINTGDYFMFFIMAA